ncbi:universal stress protein [Chryseobacterium salipaludis]|uniref:universal stress protein n=1 Tax=Chryseobacterium TaxID=59732 RepID=UPI001FF1019F|nr:MULTISPECIES: universal stress protein [Chryseobacterium]MCJ8498022.1 universal stress protein [Chryseobacterium salipaludis]MCX3296779.1 universal stress protein [Planobacterium sp. JC490]
MGRIFVYIMEATIQTILVTTDFSSKSDNAVILAAHMAKRHQSRLLLAHSQPSYYLIDHAGKHPVGGTQLEENIKQTQQKLEQICSDLVTNFGIIAEPRLSTLSLLEMVNTLIRQEETDLVVAGTSGRQTMKEFVLGSNSYALLQHSACSLMLVPEDFNGTEFKKILFPVRFEEGLPEKTELSLLIAARNQGEINVLGLGRTEDVIQLRKAVQETRRQLLQQGHPTEGGFAVGTDNAAMIVHHAGESEADIVLLADQDENSWRSFLGDNFFKKIMNGTRVPLLVVKSRLLRAHDTEPDNDAAGFDMTMPVPG